MTAIPVNNPVLLLAIFLLLLVIGPFFFSLYCDLSPSRALCAMIASAAAGIGCFLNRASVVPGGYSGRIYVGDVGPYTVHLADKSVLSGLAAGACIVFVTGFGLRLWVRWVIGRMSAEERLPGRPGIRAWFGASNVIVGLLIVTSAWYGFGASPLVSSAVVAALLAAYPLLQTEPQVAAGGDDLSAEREKIVAMLEAGRLTSEECGELLRALGETSRRPSTARAPAGGNQRLMLLGAALVGLGFLLPWFVVNPGRELGQMMNQWQFNGNHPSPGVMGAPGFGVAPDMVPNTGNISISGGDIQHGLGWFALAFALSAAVLPYVASTLDAATAQTVRLICLGVGGIIMLYLVTTSWRFASIGLIIAIGGFVLEAAGALRERRTANL